MAWRFWTRQTSWRDLAQERTRVECLGRQDRGQAESSAKKTGWNSAAPPKVPSPESLAEVVSTNQEPFPSHVYFNDQTLSTRVAASIKFDSVCSLAGQRTRSAWGTRLIPPGHHLWSAYGRRGLSVVSQELWPQDIRDQLGLHMLPTWTHHSNRVDQHAALLDSRYSRPSYVHR